MGFKGFKETINWYDENAEEYAKFSYAIAQSDVIDKFITMLPKKPFILDAGCGPGRDAMIFYQKGATVTGVDLSSELIKIAKKKNPEITFIEGNFLNLPFKNESFDGVWAHAALVHLETIKEVKKALLEFYNVLKKRGILNVYVREQSKTEEYVIVKDKKANNERFFRYFTMDEMQQYLKEIGFTVKDATTRESRRRKGLSWLCIFAEK